MNRSLLLPLVALLLIPACSSSSPATTGSGGSSSATTTTGATGTGGAGGASSTTTTTTSSSSTGTGGGAPACSRPPAPADALRKLIVSHPYDPDGNPAPLWEVFDLPSNGQLAKTGKTFTMGKAFHDTITFTPDGKVGIAVQDDGSLGVFRVEDSGDITVVHQAFEGSFYADSIVIDPDGNHAIVLDGNWQNNGGGLYRITIGCDGTLTDEGQIAPSKNAYGMVRLASNPDHAVLAAPEVLDSTPANNAHLLDLSGPSPVLLGGAPAFPDKEAIVSSVARTPDDLFVLIADYSEFASVPNRIAVVGVGPNGLAPVQTLSPLNDPFAVVTSPYGNAAIVVSGYGNAILRLAYDPTSSAAPFTNKGPIPYNGKKPALPGSAVLVERGALRGHVYVAEDVGVRQVRFEPDGNVTDLGAFILGPGLETIVGAIGVQP
ncbi:MAG: hypothetical protein U0359_32910 [Byssovorax sp.]